MKYTSLLVLTLLLLAGCGSERNHLNEGQLLQSLVTSGSASVSYKDPSGRFVVYDIQPFVSGRQKPSSLSGCSL